MHKGLYIPIALLILLLVTGTLFYHNVEGWRYVDSLYFSAVTMTTIGYGDFSPETDIGKIFTIFFAFLGIGIAFYFFTMIGRYFFVRQKIETLEKQGRITNSKGIRKIR